MKNPTLWLSECKLTRMFSQRKDNKTSYKLTLAFIFTGNKKLHTSSLKFPYTWQQNTSQIHILK